MERLLDLAMKDRFWPKAYIPKGLIYTDPDVRYRPKADVIDHNGGTI